MKFVAKLVTFCVTTRVLVREDASELEVITKSRANLLADADNHFISDNVTEIELDEEIPFGEGYNDINSVQKLIRIKITGGNPAYIGEKFDAELVNDRAVIKGLAGGFFTPDDYERVFTDEKISTVTRKDGKVLSVGQTVYLSTELDEAKITGFGTHGNITYAVFDHPDYGQWNVDGEELFTEKVEIVHFDCMTGYVNPDKAKMNWNENDAGNKVSPSCQNCGEFGTLVYFGTFDGDDYLKCTACGDIFDASLR